MPKPVRGRTRIEADVETTFLAISSERWPAACAAELGDGSRVESREQLADETVVLTYSRELPKGAPGYLSSFLPKDGRVTQTDTWHPVQSDGSRTGTWHISFAGAPGQVGGTFTLAPDGDGCVWNVTGEAKVKIPLIGGKAEGFLAPLVEKVIVKQGPILQELVRG